ncbi:MAG TPA: UPF0149 family protein [Gammaproteobacteria bacterium]|jgi:hypothetical protein|nr:hypothetical protein [Chromatiales bacterium]MCP4926569.1 UPF0149 family protein [Gammaproteobacteria bacterium]MDP7296120.1 UPF0149 family protein [Gammaproteobacteria bacterium]MDP7660749.1 UPF0149 family protein [Gammaproteobacteria bacterium]HJP38951.1 UPF0149 family protein [Gammaproteobacteria bacterium]
MGSAVQPDFATVEAVLRDSGALSEPAEIHGEYCGLVCIMGADAAPAWVASVFAETENIAGDGREVLESLATATWNALDQGDMGLELLLPGDDDPLEARAESLGFWCQGFMHGLGAGHEAGAGNPLLAEGITREIITDFSEITRAAFTADETSAEGEAAYVEITEFIRVSVQLAFEELHRVRKSPNDRQHH